ncbi:hypothetical protein OBBRIDRAFT_786416 [Obba rivulosa]|uniref:Uncharacterized protein n=1 Tax=Obba rivulosa TaxID=1052685 RepID=A0A8E2DEZ3_9APHY|nr:hypothetical protein OBBRIDRAFT_786416 [Obba rivulosa]
MLNRRSFVEGSYDRGAMAFVSEYWLMIHRAAGWGALRGFLFSLMANRYLTMEQMLRVLRHYESHTGMQYWYKDSEVTEQQV